MDKQELYVAASRARGQTRLYATPEIQGEREEIAPRSAHPREGLPHIAAAAERDRAQLAAHEVARRAQFAGLPSAELVARHRELSFGAERERLAEERRTELRGRIGRAQERLGGFEAEREAASSLRRRQRRRELGRIDAAEARSLEALSRLEG